MQGELVNYLKSLIREGIEDWNRFPRMMEFFKDNAFVSEEDDVYEQKVQWTKDLSDFPYGKTVAVRMSEDNQIEVFISESEVGNSKTWGDTFNNELQAISYIDAVIKGKILESKKNWSKSYSNVVNKQLNKNADALAKPIKKDYKHEYGKTAYGKGSYGWWGGLQDYEQKDDDDDADDAGDVGDGGGDGGGE